MDIPELCVAAFEVIGLYSSWLDINLIINDKTLTLISETIASSSQSFGSNAIYDSHVKIAALKALCDVLNKKMEPLPKVQFLERMYDRIVSQDLGFTFEIAIDEYSKVSYIPPSYPIILDI
ncbi:unnamed protein product [Gordionus sp. m RMFG-2023]